MKLRLFSRQDCPLCEDVEDQLNGLGVQFEFIDIDESEELLKKYHVRVPVLKNSLNNSLNWPFDEKQLMDFINEV
jgi:glutaredoxin-related protein